MPTPPIIAPSVVPQSTPADYEAPAIVALGTVHADTLQTGIP